MSREHILKREQDINRPRDDVFQFFSSAANLEAITPPWLNFEILTPQPITMAEGARLEYRIRLFRVPIRWKTRIESWEPPHRFVDTQVSGPYTLWHHTHLFVPTPEGVHMTDVVRYIIPYGPIGAVARLLFVRRLLDRIFDYRRDRVAELLPPVR